MKVLFVFISVCSITLCYSQNVVNPELQTVTNLKTMVLNVEQADESMILKETPAELQKNKQLNVIQPDQSMILIETPENLKKYSGLSIITPTQSMLILETPEGLKR